MSKDSERNFVLQQGFPEVSSETCSYQYPALMWQPRLIALIVPVGLILQAWPLFVGLSAILWWNVAVPSWNPFDLSYNLFAAKSGRPKAPVAPAPRRFSQGMAACFMGGIGASLYWGWPVAAYTLEALLVVALVSLVVGRFCLGSYIFHVLTGQTAFANRTLPWAKTR